MENIKLKSADGVIFETDTKITKCSGTITTLLKDCCMGDDEIPTVPLFNVDSIILQKVLEWANFHKNDPQPMEVDENNENKEKRTDDISPWDTKFLEEEPKMLAELIMAANYLNIKPLLTVTCKFVADSMKGKSTEQIRELFGIENDFNPEEEKHLRKESEWCVEKPN